MKTAQSLKDQIWQICDDLEAELALPDRVLPDPGLLNYYLFNQARKVLIEEEVDAYETVIPQRIILWNIEDAGKPIAERKPITIYIMSPGGSLDSMWAIIDAIMTSTTPVRTVNLGMADSAAALVFLSGAERLMMPNAKVMLHEGSARMSGDANKVLDSAENYAKDIKRMSDYVLERTEIPKNVMSRHRKDDWYIDSETCLKYRICTAIVESVDDII